MQGLCSAEILKVFHVSWKITMALSPLSIPLPPQPPRSSRAQPFPFPDLTIAGLMCGKWGRDSQDLSSPMASVLAD